jgi:mannose-6-phosphate isomerase-like protein (cupin superfamily)
MRPMTVFGLMLATLPFGMVQAQTEDSRVTLLSHNEVSDAFARGKPLIEVGDYKIHASRRDSAGIAEIHTRDTDIVYVLKGSAILVTGGTPLDVKSIGAEELRGTSIAGGNTSRLVAGDIVVIPNGVLHWFKEVKAPFLYYVVKVRQAARPVAIGAAR